MMTFDTTAGNLFRFFKCFHDTFKIASDRIANKLIEDMHQDQPVLVLYDQAIFFMKVLVKMYKKRYNVDLFTVSYLTTFMFNKGMYSDMKLIGVFSSFKNMAITVFDLIHWLFSYYRLLIFKFGLSLSDAFYSDGPLAAQFLVNDYLNITYITPGNQMKEDDTPITSIKDMIVRSFQIVTSNYNNPFSTINQVCEKPYGEINNYFVDSSYFEDYNMLNFDDGQELVDIGYKYMSHQKIKLC
jgi:hypothetical protein